MKYSDDPLKYRAEWIKEYYKKNGDRLQKQREQNRKRYLRRMYWLSRYKMSKGCERCGFAEHPAALQFDHLHSKEFHVTSRIMGRLRKLFKEIRKCRILCANCHAIHTHGKIV